MVMFVCVDLKKHPVYKPKSENTHRLCHAEFDSPIVKVFKKLLFFPTEIGYGPSPKQLIFFLLYREEFKICGRVL